MIPWQQLLFANRQIERPITRQLSLLGFLFLVANWSYAQLFSHQVGRKHVEAEVMHDRLVVKERNDLEADSTSLLCPLGPAVRANVSTGNARGTRVCLVFSKQICTYSSRHDGKPIQGREVGQGGSSFKCIELGTVQQAETLAAMVNAGPQQQSHEASVRSAITAATVINPPSPQQAKPAVNVAEKALEDSPSSRQAKTQNTPAAATPVAPEAVAKAAPRSERTQPPTVAQSSQDAKTAVEPIAPAPPTKQTIASASNESKALTAARQSDRTRDQDSRAVALVTQRASKQDSDVSTAVPAQTANGLGRWILSRFVIKSRGNERLTNNTYATASIVDKSGQARMSGNYIYIRNESTTYPLYYGLRETADKKLLPGQDVTVPVENHDSDNKENVTRQMITLKWYDQTATSAKRSIK